MPTSIPVSFAPRSSSLSTTRSPCTSEAGEPRPGGSWMKTSSVSRQSRRST
jgi:hypothetical protein